MEEVRPAALQGVAKRGLEATRSTSLAWLMASQAALVVKNLLAHAGDIETWVRTLGREDTLEEGMATHSSVLAWEIPRTEKPVGL